MGHDHHNHDHTHTHSSGNIKRAFWVNLIFTVIEIIGGIYTNSLAILSDAVHDLGDSLSLGMAWYFEKYSKKSRDNKYSYGYRRYSLLSATINSFVICLSSIFILTQAIPRLIHPQHSDAKGMIVLAILGIIANGYALFGLNKNESVNERTVFFHLLEDVLGWVAVLIGAIIMLWKDWPIIDPILSVLIALYIFWNVFKNLRNAVRIFLQGIPKNISMKQIRADLLDLTFVGDLHDLHVWSMDGDYHVATMHVCLKSDYNLSELQVLKSQVMDVLKRHEVQHATIEFEHSEDPCDLEDC
jgi:cobalt-zinc-cadmium efflux system protein